MRDPISMTAIILAGGKSSRMRRDKALLPFGEKTMLEHIVDLVSPIFDETIVIVDTIAKVENLKLCEAQVYDDLIKNRGPLAGIYTGLSHSKTRANCVFTCDMPFIDPFLVEELVKFWEENYDVICLEDTEGRLQPFPGIYDRSSRHLMRLLLDKGYGSMLRFLEVVTAKLLVLKREKIQVLTNMNTVEDYYRVLSAKKDGSAFGGREKQEKVME